LEKTAEMRKSNNESIRMQYRVNAEENRKLIRESSNFSFMENVSKVQKVHEYKKSKNQGK
jgi:hypothetical protein